MTEVSTEFLARWRQEIVTFGSYDRHRTMRPVTQVFVRRGRLRRNWHPWTGPDVNAWVVDGNNDEPWQATYHDYSDWTAVPNVLSCDISGSIEDHGQSATIVAENVYVSEESGFAGLYHAINRGYLAPWRGLDTEFTPPAIDDTNEWSTLLDQKLQIKIWQGYGDDELSPTFVGFIDDLDMVSVPDQITITARDCSQIAVDQRFYGWSKIRDFPDPITFGDRYLNSETTKVGSNANASSEQSGHEASNVLDGDSDTRWLSDDHGDPDHTEWIEIELPAGVYQLFRLNTKKYRGMLGHISIDSVDGTVNGTPIADGWYDPDLTNVPDESYPYFKTFLTNDGTQKVNLGFTYTTEGGAKLRLSFTNLKQKGDDYRAGVVGFKAIRIEPEAVEGTHRWILVDDLADIVRVILRWCGFKEWYVEDADMRLKKPWTVSRESFLMDMIEQVCEWTGFVFYIADPTTDDDSLGMPVFRMRTALDEQDADELAELETIHESDLIQRAQVRFTNEVLSYNIRVRGRHATKDEGGIVVSRDDRRLLAYYLPPWTADGDTPHGKRTAGIIKRTFLDRWYLSTQDGVEYAARLVGLYEALAAGTASVQIPANPGIELEHVVLLYDTATGLNTRLWTSERNSRYVGGQDAEWTMDVGGSLLDTPFMDDMRADMKEFLETVDD